MVFWPTYGRGEIDLELLGNRPDSIMCPIWAPFDVATTPEPKELDPASAVSISYLLPLLDIG